MKKKLTVKEKRRIFLFIPTSFLLIILISYNLINYWYQLNIKSKNIKFLKEELERLKVEERELSKKVKWLQDPEYVGRYAREKFLYSKDGEILIKIK